MRFLRIELRSVVEDGMADVDDMLRGIPEVRGARGVEGVGTLIFLYNRSQTAAKEWYERAEAANREVHRLRDRLAWLERTEVAPELPQAPAPLEQALREEMGLDLGVTARTAAYRDGETHPD